ncbi:MAG: Rieske (2Fe-2S) protein [Lentimicrobiaceae bacterium]|nr:Rieske (2Fe-2S) protein [Lentimicrobiaceae bacterium]
MPTKNSIMPILRKFVCFTFIFLLIIFTGCDKENEATQIPYIYVNFEIYPNTLDFIPETGYIYVTGGYKGIIIYRLFSDEFMAYERACPHDPLVEGARIQVESSGIIAVDSVCGSRFLLTDGSPLKGSPATRPLKQYRTNYDGYVLRVMN